jgi:hypothetical protein
MDGIFLFYFSSLVITTPCWSPVDRLVLNSYDLHIHSQYRQCCKDGNFLFFSFSSLVIAAPCLSLVDQLVLN